MLLLGTLSGQCSILSRQSQLCSRQKLVVGLPPDSDKFAGLTDHNIMGFGVDICRVIIRHFFLYLVKSPHSRAAHCTITNPIR
jgi:hypothetical protein